MFLTKTQASTEITSSSSIPILNTRDVRPSRFESSTSNDTETNISLRTFTLIVFGHPYCARKFHVAMAQRHSSSAPTEEDLLANIALLVKTTTSPGFCGLKKSVTPTFFWTHRLF